VLGFFVAVVVCILFILDSFGPAGSRCEAAVSSTCCCIYVLFYFVRAKAFVRRLMMMGVTRTGMHLTFFYLSSSLMICVIQL